MTKTLLNPQMLDNKRTMREIEQNKIRQTQYYNRGAKHLPELHPGDNIRVAPRIGKERHWTPGTVKKKVNIRSYEVEREDGRIVRRNRRHLRLNRANDCGTRAMINGQGDTEVECAENNPSTKDNNAEKSQTADSTPGPTTLKSSSVPDSTISQTRSGRVVKPPSRFNDFVKQ